MRIILTVSLVLTVSACESASELVEPSTDSQSSLAWSCYDPTDPHCSPIPPPNDPDSRAPGIFLGSDFALENCYGQDDSDQDGMHDFCEYQLAVSFRPLLAMDPSDLALGREPAWAVGLSPEGLVRIAYLFSYYADWGNTHDCNPMGWWCGGHFGDSEFVMITIYYNPETQHWVFLDMFSSAHWGTVASSSELTDDTNTEFPAHSAWYPRVWVALHKHANYPTRALCNAGSFGTDTCESNVDYERFYVSPLRNVGSSVHPLIDAIGSSSYRTGTEYYWNESHAFCGWDGGARYGDPSDCSTAYGTILRELGL